MALRKPKHVAVVFSYFIMFYTIKLCWTTDLYILLHNYASFNDN